MNINWKPKIWVAVLLGVLLQGFTFLYLNRPKIFWLYLLLSAIFSAIDFKYQTSFMFLFSIACPIHAYLIVKKFELFNRRAWYSKWWGILVSCIGCFITVFLFRSFLYEPFILPSTSMQPTLSPGNRIIVNKMGYRTYDTYGFTFPREEIASTNLMQRGKLYAFYPPNKETPFVKRLIALPGDTISIKDNEITINGSKLITNLLHETNQLKIYEQTLGNITYQIQQMKMRQSKDIEEIKVPKKSYFFMGDNRDNSADSRYWGYVTSDSIIGEVVSVIK